MLERAPSRKAALLITRNLPPLRGGMERLVQHLARALFTTHALTVVGPQGCKAFLPAATATHEVPHRPLPRFLWSCVVAVLNCTRSRSFAIAIAGSGLTAPMAWWSARRTGARSVVYLHGLDIIAPSRLYRLLWLPYIRRIDLVLVNSRNTRRLAIDNGVPARAIQILHPGTYLPDHDVQGGKDFRTAHDLGDRPLLLSVGRLTPRKGLAEFIRDALPAVLANYPDTLLLVVGGDATDAVRQPARSERARIQACTQQAGMTSFVRFLPHCSDAELAQAYRAADVYVFPVVHRPGDVEGFGMVAIEAAAHGLPTVCFRVDGVPDAVVAGRSGTLVDADDYAGFAAAVSDWLSQRDSAEVEAGCRSAAAAFSWDRFADRLDDLLYGSDCDDR